MVLLPCQQAYEGKE